MVSVPENIFACEAYGLWNLLIEAIVGVMSLSSRLNLECESIIRG